MTGFLPATVPPTPSTTLPGAVSPADANEPVIVDCFHGTYGILPS